MAQFDVHVNRSAGSEADFPYLLDIQSNLVDVVQTRVVVPLMPLDRFGTPIERLNPVFEIDGARYAAVFTELAGVHRSVLGEVVASFAERSHEITSAADFLIQGF